MNFFRSIFKSPQSTTVQTPRVERESQIAEPEVTTQFTTVQTPREEESEIAEPERNVTNSNFTTPVKEKPADLSETDASLWTDLENVPNRHELMRHFNMTEVLVKEIAQYIKPIFKGKLEIFNKKRAIVNEWVKEYLPEEWREQLAERDKYKGKRTDLPENIREIRDRADEIMIKVKYRVNLIRDSVEWEKERVGVSAGGCRASSSDEVDDIVNSLEKMDLRPNPRPPVRLDPSPAPTRPRSPPRNRVIHQATAVAVISPVVVIAQERVPVSRMPEDDESTIGEASTISDLTPDDVSLPSIDTVEALPLSSN